MLASLARLRVRHAGSSNDGPQRGLARTATRYSSPSCRRKVNVSPSTPRMHTAMYRTAPGALPAILTSNRWGDRMAAPHDPTRSLAQTPSSVATATRA
jgi:hypothetical protein